MNNVRELLQSGAVSMKQTPSGLVIPNHINVAAPPEKESRQVRRARERREAKAAKRK